MAALTGRYLDPIGWPHKKNNGGERRAAIFCLALELCAVLKS